VVKIAAVLIGGSWAYIKFIKGRVYHVRLEPSIAARSFRRGESDCLLATVRVKNVGASKVDIEQRGTALRIFGCPVVGKIDMGVEIPWTRLKTVTIFDTHGWVEAGETIDDMVMILLPRCLVAIKMELRIVANGKQWKARAIIDVPEQTT
jgi:hypothetical protein